MKAIFASLQTLPYKQDQRINHNFMNQPRFHGHHFQKRTGRSFLLPTELPLAWSSDKILYTLAKFTFEAKNHLIEQIEKEHHFEPKNLHFWTFQW